MGPRSDRVRGVYCHARENVPAKAGAPGAASRLEAAAKAGAPGAASRLEAAAKAGLGPTRSD